MHSGQSAIPGAQRVAVALLLSTAVHLVVICAGGTSPYPFRQPRTAVIDVFLRETEKAPVTNNESMQEPPETTTALTEPSRNAGHAAPQPEPGNAPAASPGMHYFLSSEVDVPAEPVSRPSITYPEHALLSKLSGVVRARLFIDVDGRVDSIEIIELRPHYPPFEEIAINALIETRFSPAKRFGNPVNSQKVVEVFFNPYEDVAGKR